MNFPAVAKKTYESLKSQDSFVKITNFVLHHLKKISSPLERARFVHNVVDEYNKEVFAHPLLQEFVPCKSGCSACCHTQVSVTADEAALLASHIEAGLKINLDRLKIQEKAKNDSAAFYKLSYTDRGCVFLNDAGSCTVYKDRPSVCRTNAVVGSASQCDTRQNDSSGHVQSQRLVNTPKADMAIIGSFMEVEGGSLAYMLSKALNKLSSKTNKSKLKKVIFKDREL